MIKRPELTTLATMSQNSLMNVPSDKYSVKDSETIIRNAIVDACGGEFTYYKFEDNKNKVYEILSEVLNVPYNEFTGASFEPFVEYHDTRFGDTKEFRLNQRKLLRVSAMAGGNADIRRQKIYENQITISTKWYGIAIYEEFERFVAGHTNWDKLVDTLRSSWRQFVAKRIFTVMNSAFTALATPYAIDATWDDVEFLKMVEHVRAETGMEVAVFGSLLALNLVPSTDTSESAKREKEISGFYGKKLGVDMFKLEQFHEFGTTTFVVPEARIYIIPIGQPIVQVVNEGYPIVREPNSGEATNRNDMQIQMMFMQKIGFGAVTPATIAVYDIQTA